MEKELLHRFFSGEASEREQARVLDWIESDARNQHELLTERRLYDAMLMLAPAPAAPRRRMLPMPRWTREVLKYAAVVLLTIGLAGGYLAHLYDRMQLAGNTITVPAGQRVDVTLPDGTKVCMNALSELRYPTFFLGKRRVQLRGEAFFEVSHDTRRPFVVETFACDVEVLGTKFDVEADPAAGRFVTSLVEGKVRVTDRNDVRNRVELKPRQQVRHLHGRLLVSDMPHDEEFGWREGLITFRDASFPELISEFEKYYGVRIDLGRSEVTRTLFTGKIRISEGIDHALWVLQQSADFSYTRNDAKNTIYIH